MAKIVSTASLTATEVTITPATKKITLNIAGNLSTDGVNLDTLYSYLKQQWKTDANLIKYPFPMVAVTVEQFELVSGWDFFDVSSKNLVRDGGWSLKADITGTLQETFMNLTSLGNFDNPSLDKAYYLQSSGGSKVNVVLTGPVNQGIKIYGDASHGNFDYRTFFKIYLREQGKTYAFYDLIADQNLTTLENKKYALPLSNGADLKITATDAQIDANSDGDADVAPYTSMDITYLEGVGFTSWTPTTVYPAKSVVKDVLIQNNGSTLGTWWYTVAGGTSSGSGGTSGDTVTWVTYTGQRQIGLEWYAYNKIVDGNNAIAEKIYEFTQWSLRQTVDIDAGTGTAIGNIAVELMGFIGDTLKTRTGVYIDNFIPADTNRLQFVDYGGTTRTYPFVAAGSLLFNDNLVSDADSIYRVFFTNDDAGTNLGKDYGTATAITIQNTTPVDIAGSVSATPSIGFDYDYDGNIQRGAGSAGTDVPYTAVAVGLSKAQFVVTTGTLVRSTANSINFVAALERNYFA